MVMIVNKNMAEAAAMSEPSKAHNPLAEGPSLGVLLRERAPVVMEHHSA